MVEKPKAGGEKKPPAEEKEEKTQADRFIETARKLGADESGEKFERAFKRVISKDRSSDDKRG